MLVIGSIIMKECWYERVRVTMRVCWVRVRVTVTFFYLMHDQDVIERMLLEGLL